jgi:hypothetical protein
MVAAQAGQIILDLALDGLDFVVFDKVGARNQVLDSRHVVFQRFEGERWLFDGNALVSVTVQNVGYSLSRFPVNLHRHFDPAHLAAFCSVYTLGKGRWPLLR